MRLNLSRLQSISGVMTISCFWQIFALGASLAIICCGPIFGADAAPPPSLDLHTFTNHNGKTIQAVITDATLDNVFLKRDDGQTFKVPLASLSDEDQTFVSKWVIQRASKQGSDILKISATANKLVYSNKIPNANERITVTSTRGTIGHPKIVDWQQSYNIKVSNLLPARLEKLYLRYIIFSQAAVPGALPPNDFTSNIYVGADLKLDELPASAEKSVVTNAISLAEYTLPPNFVYKNGAPLKATDKINGIWVRIYDESDKLLQEWASSPSLVKENDWDEVIKKASEGPPTRGFGTRGRGAGGMQAPGGSGTRGANFVQPAN